MIFEDQRSDVNTKVDQRINGVGGGRNACADPIMQDMLLAARWSPQYLAFSEKRKEHVIAFFRTAKGRNSHQRH